MSQGEKGKSLLARVGDIIEDESGKEQELDLQPQTHAQLVTGAKYHSGCRVYVEIFLLLLN